MYSFQNDYSDGGHPAIIEALAATSDRQCQGYGLDRHCVEAADLLRQRFGCQQAEVHFLPGGTLTNLTVIGGLLRPHEAVISADCGHIEVHETGAIEATGHKILTVPSRDGKLRPADILSLLAAHHFEHMVKPRLVYISQSTELGTVYRRAELAELHRICQENGLLLYMDGARLGAALCCQEDMPDAKELCQFCDAFYIGGTKNGALFGEALVLCNPEFQEFRYLLKQRGGLLAKGRVMGVQFKTLFQGDLYFDLARHANRTAQRLATGIQQQGYPLLIDSPTNQIFPILPDPLVDRLQQEFLFYKWQNTGNKTTAIRLVTSWATADEAVERLLATVESGC